MAWHCILLIDPGDLRFPVVLAFAHFSSAVDGMVVGWVVMCLCLGLKTEKHSIQLHVISTPSCLGGLLMRLMRLKNFRMRNEID